MSEDEDFEVVEKEAVSDEINTITNIGVHTSTGVDNPIIHVTGITGGKADTVFTIGYLQGNVMVPRDHKLKALKDKTIKETRSHCQGMMKTRAVEEILSRFSSNQHWVTICGHPGEGKTTAAYLVCEKLLQNQQLVFHVDTPEDYFTVIRKVSNCVILLNDVLGPFAFDPLAFSRWESVIHHFFEEKKHESNSITVLFVSRTNVLEGARYLFGPYELEILGKDVVIDLSRVTEDSVTERTRLLDWHCRDSIMVTDYVKAKLASGLCPFGFAYCCSLYAELRKRNDAGPDIEEFFAKPIEFLGQTTKVLVAHPDTNALFKAMLKCGGSVNLELLLDSEKYTFLKVVNELKGCYLKLNESFIEFSHPSIQESVAHFIGKDDPLFAVKHFDMSFLLQKVKFTDVQNDSTEFLDIIPTENLIKLFCLRSGQIILDLDFSILQNDLFKRKDVCEQLFEHCLEVQSFVSRLTNRLLFKKGQKLDINSRDRNGYTMLHAAHRGGNREAIDTLLKLGADVNIYSERWGMKQSTYFQLACMEKLLDADHIRQMVDEGAKLDLQLPSGDSILHHMYRIGEHQLVRFLLYRGSDPNARDAKDKTLLHLMCKDDCSVSYIEVLIENGANVNKIKQQAGRQLWTRRKRGKTALHYLCSRDCNIKLVELLLRKGADVDVEDKLGRSPLHYACGRKNLQVVKELLQYEANPNAVDDSGNTPLHYLYDSGNYKGIQLLLDKGADVNIPTQEGKTLLHYECQSGKLDPDFFQLLLKHGADVNGVKRKKAHKKKCGKAPLHYLAKRHTLKQGRPAIGVLIQNGANINCRDTKGKTPLQLAYETDNDELFTYLLEQGSDVTIEDTDGLSLLHRAFHDGKLDKLKEILKHGADVNKNDKEGKTLLHCICSTEGSDPCLVELLLEKGAHVDIRKEYKLFKEVMVNESFHEKIQKVQNVMKSNGKTSLHYACKFQKDSTIIKTLLAAGASVNMTDRHGMTPLLYLLVNEDMDFGDLCFLVGKGADPCQVNSFGQTALDLLYTRRNVDTQMVDSLLQNGVTY